MGAALRKPAPYLTEGRALYNLCSDGHGRLRYHVSRGPALRDVASKQPVPGSYVPRGTWRPAWDVGADGSERDRLLNPYVVQQHVQGSYDVAFEFPSWTSLLVFDVDRHLPDGMSEEECHPELVKIANEHRDETMDRLWKALGLEGKGPVVLRTPGGGYHVYLPLCRYRNDPEAERTWPAAWLRERVEHQLNRHGVGLRPGVLELFPSGGRLRMPCGAGMLLLDDDRQPVEGTFEERGGRLTRRIKPMVEAFCEAIEHTRKPFEEWLDQGDVRWTPEWGPWGIQRKNEPDLGKGELHPDRHKVEVLPGTEGPALRAGLLYGSEFIGRVQELARSGLTEVGQRHDAALKLVWYWVVCRGLSEEEAVARLSDWLDAHVHVSHLLPGHPRKFIQDTVRESRHYARSLSQRGAGQWVAPSRSVDVAPPSLDQAEDVVLARAAPELRDEVRAILRHLRSHAAADGRVPHPVNLSGHILEGICGNRRIRAEKDGVLCSRRSYVMAIERLVELGVLALHTNYSTGRHGKLYTCWYRFGSGTLPASDDRGDLLLAEREVEEGTLRVVARGSRMPAVRLELDERTWAPAGPFASPAAFGRLWWVRMFQRRAFTPAEFLEGDARKLIPGPFRHRFPSTTAPPVEILPPRIASPPAESGPASSSTDLVTAAADLGRPRPADSHEVVPEPDPAPRPSAPDRVQIRSAGATAAERAGPPAASESREEARPTPAGQEQQPPDALPADIEELLSLLPSGPLREQVRSTWRDWLQRGESSDSS